MARLACVAFVSSSIDTSGPTAYTQRNDSQRSAPSAQVTWLRRGPSTRVARSNRMRQVRNDRAGPCGRDIEPGLLRRIERDLESCQVKDLVVTAIDLTKGGATQTLVPVPSKFGS